MTSTRLLVRLFLAWLIVDLVFLAVGLHWSWSLGIALHGLVIDLLLGVFIAGQYLNEKGKL
jgi:hypothetical protein